MTQTWKNLSLFLSGLILGLLAAAGVAQLSSRLTEDPAPVVQQESNAAPATVQLGETAGAETLSPTQITQVALARDRVCEGMTAGVPLVVLEPSLAQEFGMTGAEAHAFVKDVAWAYCPTAGR